MITCKVVFCQSKALSIAFFPFSFKTVLAALLRTTSLKVSVKENEVPTKKNSSRASIFATKVSYISN